MKKITYISLLFFITSIFCLFMGFFGLKNTFADDMVATGISGTIYHYVKGGPMNESKNYLIFPSGNTNYIYNITNSGAQLVNSSGYIGTYSSNHNSIISLANGVANNSTYRFDFYDGSSTLYFIRQNGNNSAVGILINNINGKYYTYYLEISMFGYASLDFNNLKFLVSNNKLIFYVSGKKFFSLLLVDNSPTIQISSGNEPGFINTININNGQHKQFVYGESNYLRSCSANNSTYNVYAWDITGTISNHQSLVIEKAFNRTYNNSCILRYLPFNNLTFFTQFDNNQSFSSFYEPGQGFKENGLSLGYYIYSHDIYDNTYNFYNFAADPKTYAKKGMYPGIGFFYFGENNDSHIVYQLSTELSNWYTTSTIVGNNINTPTSSGTNITGNSNNSIINNNNNNINLNPTITNTVNIPGVCPFGKKLSPIRWTNGKYYCQVNDGNFNCPYGTDIPEFFLEGYYCEIPSQQTENNMGSGVLIPDYSNILNNSGSINNSTFGTGSIESIMGGGVSIGSSSGISGLFNTTISGSTNKTNNCSTIISLGIFQYSIGKNNNFFQIKLENVDTEKMLGEANGWKLEFFGVNFLKPLYSILDFFGNFAIKIYNYVTNSLEPIIDLFGYILNNVQRNKYYCFFGEEYYVFAQSTQYKSLLDNTMKSNNGMIDIIVIIGAIITNFILLIKLKRG